jgi:hypothetical protein
MIKSNYQPYDDFKKYYDDTRALSRLDQLKYGSLEKDLAKADRLFNIFEGQCNHLVDTVLLLGKDDQRTTEQTTVVYKRAKGLGHIISKIGVSFQGKLNETASFYDEQMDKQYDKFYMPMVESFFSNIKKIKEAKDSNDPFAFAQALVNGMVPKDSPDSQQEILSQYDAILSKAHELYTAVKDTFLDSTGLLSVLAKHRISHEGNMGGKRGKINLEFWLSDMQRRKL